MAAAAQPDFDKLRAKWGVRSPQELKGWCEQRASLRYLIEALIPEKSLGVMVGTSGLGKSPLAYQMAICVAAGVPFLGAKVQKGRVLFLDFENGSHDVNDLVARLSGYLGLSAPPPDLLLWNINDCQPDWNTFGHTAVELIRDIQPRLAFIDPLSAPYPDIEKGNSEATKVYQAFRKLSRDIGCSIFALHHPKKPQSPKPGQCVVAQSLEDSDFRAWFADARGPGVLINGADVRLGVDRPGTSVAARSDIALVVRGYVRMQGEIPTMHLARDLDANGEPVGYRKVTGAGLLGNPEQEAAFGRLAPKFAFKDAKREYNKADQATDDFLKKCISIGVLAKVTRGVYEKV
jgi:hypothetical protein